MNAWWLLRSCLALTLALGLPSVAASSPTQIYNAKVTHVGDAPPADSDGESSLTLSARGVIDPDVDLAASTLTIRRVLDEAGLGGAGEMLGTSDAPILPLQLFARDGSTASNAIFATPGSLRPSVRLSIRRRSEGEVQILLKLSRAVIPRAPNLCAGDPLDTKLTTALEFSDGVHPTAALQFAQPWECRGSRLRITNPPPPPSPTPIGTPVPTPDGNLPPTARLRTDQLTRDTGQPNVVQLDGTGSTDEDGTVVSYEFSVADLGSGALVVSPMTTTEVTVEVTLAPGDYVAKLRVKDDGGAFSVPAERGFSLH